MQLKRDTDYALRILLCVAKQDARGGAGMTISEICKKTFVPVTIATRLCRSLADAEFLEIRVPDRGPVRYAARQGMQAKTIWDAVCAVEGGGALFAVFDRSTELYGICRAYFGEVEHQLADLLRAMPLSALAERASRPEEPLK